MSDLIVKKEKQQHETMATGVWTDQHGRRWAGMVDKETQAPMTLRPFGWSAPLPTMVPPQQYHSYDVQSRTFTIDYKGWLDEYAEAEREFKAFQMQVAKHHFGAAALEKIKADDADLKRLAGAPPQGIQYIKAMAAGNKWALGLQRPDGTPYPRPAWADDAYASWQVSYTLGDTGELVLDDAEAFPDVEDEPVGVGAGRPDWLGDDVFADEAPTTTRRSRKGAA